MRVVALLVLALALVVSDEMRSEACEPFAGAGTASAPDPGSAGGDALLILPKNAAGTIPRDFELAPGARVVSSRFSPVVCATIVRIQGAAGATPAELVERIPAEAIVVPNSTYEPGSVSIRAVPELPASDTPSDSPSDQGGAESSSEPAGDPYRSLQYALDWVDVDAAAPVTRGRGARIAILDSAPDAAHPDLPEFQQAGEPSAEPGLHGTLLMGLIAAIPDNGIGIAGLSPGVAPIAIPICVNGANGETCPLYKVLSGIDSAWQEKARIVNMAVAGPPNPVLGRAVERLDDLGIAVVAAAGNEGTNDPRFPAAYPTVIGVGALDREGKPFERGNRGRSVEILAPGVEIVSTVPGGGFAFSDGTSLATAHVSAALSLLSSVAPDVKEARAALFRQAFRHPRATEQTAVLGTLCPALAELGHPCP
ncbi:MAG: S8 family serine peptidase [Myxococcota bacterium]|nr:S8 family serine peptidase [Myxococcota bacterium]